MLCGIGKIAEQEVFEAADCLSDLQIFVSYLEVKFILFMDSRERLGQSISNLA